MGDLVTAVGGEPKQEEQDFKGNAAYAFVIRDGVGVMIIWFA